MSLQEKDATEVGRAARVIAFYLPQFYPIPENDEWWGKGFTEWTNVTKAKPLFKGHVQPKLPADLGFYDLRVPELREAQAELARENGIEGFCYWHYWFGGGKRLLERPFNDVLKSGKPDFPFCLGWANESWTGIWHGAPQRTLIEQTYFGTADYSAHYYNVLPALQDPRSITVDGKKLFVIYRPRNIPSCLEFTDLWRGLAEKEGLPGLYFVGVGDLSMNLKELGVDGLVSNAPGVQIDKCMRAQEYSKQLTLKLLQNFVRGADSNRPTVCDYKEVSAFFDYTSLADNEYPVVLPGWDNTPRAGSNGYVLQNSRPEYFEEMLQKALSSVKERPFDQRLIFLKSWNEWAEGNYVEPSRGDGHGFLRAIKNVIIGN